MDDNLLLVFRGGSWYDQPSIAQIANRNHYAPGFRSSYLGVRLIRIINPLQQIAEVKNGR